jgi:hypothetical protein
VPSHMGERPIRAMHGYHPDAPQSYAALMTNQPNVPAGINAIPDMFKLMTRDAEAAHAANRGPAQTRSATFATIESVGGVPSPRELR